MAKYDKFDREKYANTFDNMFGKGSYERGMSSARTTGQKKVEASLARKEYQKRQKEIEAARKKEEKEKAKKAAEEKSMSPKEDKKKAKDAAVEKSMQSKSSSSKKKDGGILDKLVGGAKKTWKEVSRFDRRIGNAMSFGLLGEADKRTEKMLESKGKKVDMTSYMDKRKDGNIIGKGADLVADIAGMGLSGLGATGALRATGVTGKGIKALQQAHKAGNVTKPILKRGALDSLKEGAMVGAAISVPESAIRLGMNKESNTTFKDELKHVALNTALGGALDPLATVAAPALKMASRGAMDKAIGRQASDTVSAGLRETAENPALAGDIIRRQMANNTQSADGILNRSSADRMLEMLARRDNSAPRTTSPLGIANPQAQQARQLMEEISNDVTGTNKVLHPRAAENQLQKLVDMKRKNLQASETIRDGKLPVNPKLDASDSASLPKETSDPINVLARPKPANNPMDEFAPSAPTRGEFDPPAADNAPENLIDHTVYKPKKDARTVKTKVQQQFVNDTAGLRQIDQEMQKLDADGLMRYLNPKTWIKSRSKQLASDSSLEKSLLNGKGAHSVAANHVTERFEPFLKELNASKTASKEELGEYAASKHVHAMLEGAADSKAMRDSLLQDLEAMKRTVANETPEMKALREQIESYVDYTPPKNVTVEKLQARIAQSEQNSELVKYYEQFMQLQQQNLKDMYEGGLITKDLYDKLAANKTYISMHRNFDDTSSVAGMASRRPQSPLERLKGGSDAMLKDPVQEAIRNSYMTRFNIEKNKALQVVEKFAKIDKEAVMFKGVKEPNANTITIFSNGKPKHYEVPPALKSYVDNFNVNNDPDVLTNTLQKVAQMHRKLTTQYSLSFQLKSLAREPVQAIMTSRTAPTALHAIKNTSLGYVDAFFGPALQDLTKGLPKHLQFNSYKSNWDKLGGTGFQFINMTDDDLQRVAKEMMESGTVKGNIKKVNPFRMLGKFGEKVEEGTRLGEFRSAKKQGYDDVDAFYEATDVTNYKRAGDFTGKANKYVPFLNATVQGNSRVLRALSEAPERTIARGVTMLTGTSAAVYGMRFMDGVSDEQRQELQNLSQWEKDLYLHIPSPIEGDETIIAIPKAFALAQMFMNPMERALDDYYDVVMKEESVPQHIKEGIKSTLKSFVPPYEIAGATTAIEIAQNKSLFTKQEIESSYDKSAGVPKKEIEAYNQSYLTKVIANALNAMTFSSEGEGWVSPAQVDYVLKDMTGSVGTRALEVSDHALSDNAPSKTLMDQLLNPAKQFVADPTRASGNYAEIQKLAKVEKRGNSDMTGMSEDEKNAERENRGAQNYEAAFKDINKAIQAVRSDKSLTSQEKKDRITELRKEQDALGSRGIDWFNSFK